MDQRGRIRKAWRPRVGAAVSAAVIGLCAWMLAWLAAEYVVPLREMELELGDLRVAFFSPPVQRREDIVVVTITEETLSRLPFRSPIDRAYLAQQLKHLFAKKPRAVGIDIIFDQPTEPDHDAALRAVLLAAPVPVVVATGDSTHDLTPAQAAFQNRYLAGMHAGDSSLAETSGVVRHMYLGTDAKPSFVYSLYRLLMPESRWFVDHPSPFVPFDYGGLTKDGEKPFASYPLHLIELLPDDWLRAKVVLIGGDFATVDRHRTPFWPLGGEHAAYPGVAIHAFALAQLFDRRELATLSSRVVFAIVGVASVLGLALGSPAVTLAWRATGAVAVVLLYWTLTTVAFHHGVASAPLVGPTLALVFGLTGSSAYFGRRERAARAFLKNAFGHYVSPQVIDSLMDAPDRLNLGGETRELSFVFTDLTGFTTLTERLPPQTLVSLLQDYLDGLVQAAFAHDATIDHFVGDGLHLFFGAPTLQVDHAERALRCALALDEYCERFRREREQLGVGVTRIGVHSGEATVGNFGGKQLFSYTAHGDAVNTTSRIETVNKLLGTRVCVSQAVVDAVHDDCYHMRPVGDLVFKGKEKPVRVYSPGIGLDDTLYESYLEAFELLLECPSRVRDQFEALARTFPLDGLVAFHLARIRSGETGALIRLTEK